MQYFKQFLIIISISFLGEFLNMIIPIPVPGSIYGMLLLFIMLCIGIIKVQHVKEVSKFLIDIMPILFIPSAVGIMTQFPQLKCIWLPIIIITIVSTTITMVVTGRVSQFFIRKKKGDDIKQ